MVLNSFLLNDFRAVFLFGVIEERKPLSMKCLLGGLLKRSGPYNLTTGKDLCVNPMRCLL